MANFYFDHDVDRRCAEPLRRLGHSVSTAYDEGLSAAGDDEQLVVAVQRNATLITHNFDDFKLLHSAWFRWARLWNVTATHSGILVIPQQRWSPNETADEITSVIEAVGDNLHNGMFRWRPSTGWYEIA